MKKIILISTILCMGSLYVTAQNAAQGEKAFKSICAACHSVGKGKVVGPDLSGVTDRRTETWLLSFIKSSQTMVKKGDPVAVKLFNDYNKIQMPDQNMTDPQIKDILAYVKSLSPKTTAPASAPPKK
ncbi:MAG: cytochrome c [Bacteroidia bacterium]|nr:cytochrome c [Bacteroidia bacterium]